MALETAVQISVKLKSPNSGSVPFHCILKAEKWGILRSFPPSEPSFCLHMGEPDVREIRQTFAAVMGGEGCWVELMRFPGFALTHQNTFDFYCRLRVYYLQLPPQSLEFAPSC